MILQLPRFNQTGRLNSAAENNPPLRRGETGEAVRIVQLALSDLGYDMPVTTKGGKRLPDGIFGSETLRAVRDFQSDNHLSSDGIVGRETLKMLERRIAEQINDRTNFHAARTRALTHFE